ncbi:substrate-binding periplasmic protein [Desulfogranum japonicum]|uniref:substrate-binding periplasmic protein n=1 Tax=Desulfogranum japonicum TaxID=231447 RepID=UPI0004113EB3|nr:transporter substrate-binding domain-containing protein [Desulfogranum japonicum]
MKKATCKITGMFFAIMAVFVSYVQAETVRLAVDDANPPFMYMDSSTKKAAGLYPEMAKVLFREIGVDVDVSAYAWKRTLQLSEEGQFGVIGIYKNDKRMQIYDYSEPIFDEKIVVYAPAGQDFPFKDAMSLKGKKVGVLKGWSYGDVFDKLKGSGELTAEENSADELNFKKLLAGRLDCLLAIEEAGDSLVNKLGASGKVVKFDPPLVVNSTYIVFAKKSNQGELLKKINATVSQMKGDGSYNTMLQEIFSAEANK